MTATTDHTNLQRLPPTEVVLAPPGRPDRRERRSPLPLDDGPHERRNRSPRRDGPRKLRVMLPKSGAATAVLGYVAVRLVGLIALYVGAHALGHDFTSAATVWDGRWYEDLVGHAYAWHMPLPYDGHPPQNLAFLPLYPLAVKAVTLLGIPLVPAGLLVSLAAGASAAWGIYRIGAYLHDRRSGIALALLWGVVPQAVVESMFYTEALFTALAAWCLYALLRRRWLTAGTLCLLAGLTRASVVALLVPVCLAAAHAVVTGLRRRTGVGRPLACLLLAPAGFAAFLGYVSLREHDLDGWFSIENLLWDQRTDDGSSTFHAILDRLTGAEPVSGYGDYLVIGLLCASAVLLGLLLRGTPVLRRPIGTQVRRTPWPLTAYAAVGVAIALTSGADYFFDSKSRFLLPLFPLLLPLAVPLGRLPRRAVAVLLPAAALASAACGVYLALVNAAPL